MKKSSGEGLGVFDGNVTKITSKTVPHMDGIQFLIPMFSLLMSLGPILRILLPVDQMMRKLFLAGPLMKMINLLQMIKDNILGTQFHPEKSDLAGVKLVHDFVAEVLS